MSIRKYSAVMLAIALYGAAATAAADALEAEIQRFAAVFATDDFSAHDEAIAELQWLGLSDPRIYDAIVRHIERLEKAADVDQIEPLSLYLWALGFSGNERYLPILQRFADEHPSWRVRHRARAGLTRLEEHRRRNAVIGAGLAGAKDETELQHRRLVNMIKSDYPDLVRYAGKRIVFGQVRDEAVLTAAAMTLESRYKTAKDGLWVDALSWLARGLGRSGDARHIELLRQVSWKARSSKLRRWAANALDELKDSI